MEDKKSKLKEYWSKIDSKQKKKVAVYISVTLVCLFFAVLILATIFGSSSNQIIPKEKSKSIQLDQSNLNEMWYKSLKAEIDLTKKDLLDIKNQKQQRDDAQRKDGDVKPPPLPPSLPSFVPISPPLPVPSPSPVPRPVPPKIEPSISIIGEIEIVSNQEKDKDVSLGTSTTGTVTGDSGKKKMVVYLPPSFMEATTLSGLDAPTSEQAKSNPVPMLLRIKDLAILPNEVKADLKGCFVIAHGVGSLSTERVNLLLVTLSCISKGGKAVIDQPIKGWVVDSDGKIGLKGHVVSKMGAILARTFIAGLIGGAGDVFKAANTPTSIIGVAGAQTQTATTEQILKGGLGGGVSSAASKLQEFYLDLARQTLPVIEIGATKKVTLVISQGVNLEIKEVNIK